VEEHGQIEAFLPFELGTHGLGMPIGYPMNNSQGFIGSGVPVDAKRVVKQARLRAGVSTAFPSSSVPSHRFTSRRQQANKQT
jgi:hypothetical protein